MGTPKGYIVIRTNHSDKAHVWFKLRLREFISKCSLCSILIISFFLSQNKLFQTCTKMFITKLTFLVISNGDIDVDA